MGVAVGDVQSTFDAVAVQSFLCYQDRPDVHRPPYFVMGEAIWRLEEDDRVPGLGRIVGSP